MEWPERRCDHATTCVSGPLLMIVGGHNLLGTAISDCWIGDLTTKQWKKVSVCILDTFEIDFNYTFFSYPSLTL